MQIILDKQTSVTHDAKGTIYVTRPTIAGNVATHPIRSPYDMFDIARWLYARMQRKESLKVQDAFPKMSTEDREFLLTGITPHEWVNMFCGNGEEN